MCGLPRDTDSAATVPLCRLQQQPGVDAARIAVVGFCYGGGAAIRYAAAHPEAVAAVGVFYGRPLEEVGGVSTAIVLLPAEQMI